jgi:hypothetical protein
MLATAEQPFTSKEGASITLWEVATGKVRFRLTGHQGDVNALAFMRAGRMLVSCSTDTTALVWDMVGAPEPIPAGGLEASWKNLLADDSAQSYRAIRAFATSADGASFLGKRLFPIAVADERRVVRLIKDLDSDMFDERNKASQELDKMGEGIEPILRKALNDKPSVEVRRRLLQILEKPNPEWLRTQRALEALELAGTSAAKKVLQSLAGGAREARLTLEAKAVLERWVAPRSTSTP